MTEKTYTGRQLVDILHRYNSIRNGIKILEDAKSNPKSPVARQIDFALDECSRLRQIVDEDTLRSLTFSDLEDKYNLRTLNFFGIEQRVKDLKQFYLEQGRIEGTPNYFNHNGELVLRETDSSLNPSLV